jgi:hypothetical protein
MAAYRLEAIHGIPLCGTLRLFGVGRSSANRRRSNIQCKGRLWGWEMPFGFRQGKQFCLYFLCLYTCEQPYYL